MISLNTMIIHHFLRSENEPYKIKVMFYSLQPNFIIHKNVISYPVSLLPHKELTNFDISRQYNDIYALTKTSGTLKV